MAEAVVLEDAPAPVRDEEAGDEPAALDERAPDPAPARRRLPDVAGWWARVPPVFRALAAGYVLLRVGVFVAAHEPLALYDSQEYRAGGEALTSAHPFLSFTGHSLRTWPVPLLYALVPGDGLRILVQLLLSATAWLALAGSVVSVLRHGAVRVAAFVAVLLFGTGAYVTNWDIAILSESLAISAAVLAVAAVVRFRHRATPLNTAAAVTATVVLMFTRPQLVPLVALGAFVLAVRIALAGEVVRTRIVAAAALVLAVGWAFVVVRNVETTSADRPEGVGAFTQNFVFVLQTRIMADPEMLDWFRGQGMPAPAGVAPPSEGDGGIRAVMQRAAQNRPLVDWIAQNGQLAIVRYSVTHPQKLPASFLRDLPSLLQPERSLVAYVDVPSVLPGPVEWLVNPTAESGRKPPALPPVAYLVALFGAAAFLPRRRVVDRSLVTTAVGGFLAAAVALYLSWAVSAMEPVRHGIPFTLLLPLFAVLGTAAFVDAAVGPREIE